MDAYRLMSVFAKEKNQVEQSPIPSSHSMYPPVNFRLHPWRQITLMVTGICRNPTSHYSRIISTSSLEGPIASWNVLLFCETESVKQEVSRRFVLFVVVKWWTIGHAYRERNVLHSCETKQNICWMNSTRNTSNGMTVVRPFHYPSMYLNIPSVLSVRHGWI